MNKSNSCGETPLIALISGGNMEDMEILISGKS